MKRLWKYLDGKNWKMTTKFRAAMWIVGTVFALVGFCIWLIIRVWVLSTWDWMICFIGYPFILSLFVVFLYSCRHDFHDGSAKR